MATVLAFSTLGIISAAVTFGLSGTWNGVTIIDDFGHHPTAMRETLQGLRHRFPHRRIWALFEPRSNTTRRAVFQKELPAALGLV